MSMVRACWLLAPVLCLLARPARAGSTGPDRSLLPNRVPGTNELAQYRHEVETLRGLKFRREVPTRTISEEELRSLVNREIAKANPGRELSNLQELLAWLDFIPPSTDLASVAANLMVDQVAGLYDSDTGTMCIPSFQSTNHTAAGGHKDMPQKKLEAVAGVLGGLVFTHEYTHALEDQYWPMDDPNNEEGEQPIDRAEAKNFLMEGSATRLMVETAPAELQRHHEASYRVTWNLLHSGMGEMLVGMALSQVWQSPEALVPGVPETLSRGQAMPYSFGYLFCRRLMRDWGLDGLDYMYDHRPVSTEQVMHPDKAWAWRDFPVQISLPETLPGGWKRLTEDTIGEAGTSVLLGCQLKNLKRGERLGCGWDGDRVALYEGADGHRLLAWVSAWDSNLAAERFARACVEERRLVHQAQCTKEQRQVFAWKRPDGSAGRLPWDGRNVLLFETDQPAALDHIQSWARSVTFTQPPEDAARAAANPAWARFNPLVSWRNDGEYSVTRAVGGLLWRHDQNSVGAADRAVLGLAGGWRRTASLNRWQLGWGLVARHQSEARRGVTKTTLLPWGLLWSHSSAALPYAPTNTVSRSAAVWGLAAAVKTDANDWHVVSILPGGLLFKSTTAPGLAARHVLGTGITRRDSGKDGKRTTRFRLLGITVWTR